MSRCTKVVIVAGIVLRLAFVLAAGRQNVGFHSGGNDAAAYALLARNMLEGRGYSYAGMPSAYRPPGYPLLLAALMVTLGSSWLLGLRLLQFGSDLVTVWACGKCAENLFGRPARSVTVILGLFMPTLLFGTAQVATECFATSITALFLLLLIKQWQEQDFRSDVSLGILCGVGILFRFNLAALSVPGCVGAFLTRKFRFARAFVIVAMAMMIVSPWLIRNWHVFGYPLLSTHSGQEAEEGVVMPEGRAQPGETEREVAAVGYAGTEIETNDPSRLRLSGELVLQRHAQAVAVDLWTHLGFWKTTILLAEKLGAFWLSTDQVLHTSGVSRWDRILRWTGVAYYWAVLGLAIAGWDTLRRTHKTMAWLLLFYAVFLTLVHFPFVMNTRMRIPFMEPLLLILAGGNNNRLEFLGLARD